MPLREYQCPMCGHDFELVQSFDGSSKLDCPSCKGRDIEMRRKVSVPSVAVIANGSTHAQRAG